MNMKIRSAFAVSIAILGLTASTAVYAAPTSVHAPVHAMFGNPKLVTLSLRNDSSTALELKVGEQLMTLEAGKLITLKLPVGTRILANATTPTHEAGTLLAQISGELSGATIGIK